MLDRRTSQWTSCVQDWALVWHHLRSEGVLEPYTAIHSDHRPTRVRVSKAPMGHKVLISHRSDLSQSSYHQKWTCHAIVARRMATYLSEEYVGRVYRIISPFSMETTFRQPRAMWQRRFVPHSSFCNTGPCWLLAEVNDCTRFLDTFRTQVMPYQSSLLHARRSLGGATALQHTESDFVTETSHWAS